ncbi:unnamed protein product [Ceutorhynchus assimilis]|uniref:Uncharacterized protein n=1 Tax=Ceutorhynchus assimilis TaxID=467358 RepID=A0A9N9MJQ0_9CUCU|nr:unnamed protein product [Ceutorhynchus assimilis]
MTTENTNKDLSNTVNRQLLENQSFLYAENQKLQQNVTHLSKHLEELRQSTMDPKIMDHLVKEKNHLFSLNETLKRKIHLMKSVVPGLSAEDIEKQKREKQEITKSIEELDVILRKINDRPETFDLKLPKESVVGELCRTLTDRLDDEQLRSDQAIETIRRLRDDDEKLILKDKVADMKHLITDLEVDNTKLKFEVEQMTEEVERHKNDADESFKALTSLKKEKYSLEDQMDELKQKISDLENEKLELKKDMIEELTEANRAKRVSADTEMALQHISEAYENKRREVAKIQKQLEEANGIIYAFREQFDKPIK